MKDNVEFTKWYGVVDILHDAVVVDNDDRAMIYGSKKQATKRMSVLSDEDTKMCRVVQFAVRPVKEEIDMERLKL